MSALLVAGICVITDYYSDKYKSSLDPSSGELQGEPSIKRVIPRLLIASLTFFLIFLERENFKGEELSGLMDVILMSLVMLHLIYQVKHGLNSTLTYDEWSEKCENYKNMIKKQ